VDCSGADAKTITVPNAPDCPGKFYFVKAVTGATLLQNVATNAIVANVATLGGAIIFSNGAAGAAGWTYIPIDIAP
jgi:hypothetical protein